MKKISIIVPSFNRKSYLPRLLGSFLSQSKYVKEVIIVDDGSSDGTFDFIQSLKNPLILVYRIQNSERGAARNFGAAKATGDYINFFDSDDYAYSYHCETALRIASLNNYPEWIITNSDIEKGAGSDIITRSAPSGPLLENLLDGNPLSINSIFIRRDIGLSTRFNESRDLSGSEDYDLWIRLAALYEPIISDISTSVIVEHGDRSVNNIKPEKAIRQLMLFIKLIENSSELATNPYAKQRIISTLYSYLSLQTSRSIGYRKKSLYYSMLALKHSTSMTSLKKNLVTCRNLLQTFF